MTPLKPHSREPSREVSPLNFREPSHASGHHPPCGVVSTHHEEAKTGEIPQTYVGKIQVTGLD